MFYTGYEGARCALRGFNHSIGCIFLNPSFATQVQNPIELVVFLTIAGIAGIPIGYVAYQLYQAQFHRGYWDRFPIETAPHVDRGYEALRLLKYEVRLSIAKELRLVGSVRAKERGTSYRYDPLLIGHVVEPQEEIPVMSWMGFRFARRGTNRYPAARDEAERLVRPFPDSSTARHDLPDHHDCKAEGCPNLRIQILVNWATATYVWFRVVKARGYELVEDRAAGLSDVFHSLGASRIGIMGSVPLAISIAIFDGRFVTADVAWEVGAFLILGGVMALVMKVFNSARRSTQHSLLDFYRNFITSAADEVWPP